MNFTIQALSGIPTTFNTSNTMTQAGIHGTGGPGASDGLDGSALGNSIFLRTGSSLTLMAQNTNDLLTLGDQVAFTDDTNFGTRGSTILVRGNGTVIYNGTTDYQGTINISDANFKVNGQINQAQISVCRRTVSSQRGTLSGTGILTGNVFVNSGTISPDTGGTLTLGSLILHSAGGSSLGSLVHINIDAGGTSLVAVTGAATLAGILEVNLESTAAPGRYNILTSSGFYAGVDAGFVFNKVQLKSRQLGFTNSNETYNISADFSSLSPGIQLGYMHKFPNYFVSGIGANFAFNSNQKHVFSCNSELNPNVYDDFTFRNQM